MIEKLALFEIVFVLAVLAAAVYLRKSPEDSREPGPRPLDIENFRIDSSGWKLERLPDGGRVKTNPEGDVFELLDGEFVGEQFFTLDAALRETSKAGKWIPTKDEWNEIIRSITPGIDPSGGWQDDVLVRDSLGLKLAGCRRAPSAACYLQGTNGYYWAASPVGVTGHNLVISKSQQLPPVSPANRAYGLSVRCLAG